MRTQVRNLTGPVSIFTGAFHLIPRRDRGTVAKGVQIARLTALVNRLKST